MQIKRYNKSNFFERILQIINYYDIKNVNSFAKDYLRYTSSEKINRLKKENTNPSYEILNDISNRFENINTEWLLTGRGAMLKSGLPSMVSEPGSAYIKNPPVAITVGEKIPLVSISLIKNLHASGFAFREADIKEYYVIPKFRDYRVDFLVEINETSMYPKYNSGDVIACSLLPDNHFIQWGKVYVVSTKSQGVLFKRLYKGSGGDKEAIECRSENLQYPAFEINRNEITSLALVVGVVRLD